MPANACQCLPIPSHAIDKQHDTYIARISLNVEGLRACICTLFLLCCCMCT
jgi:hypothetical protein